VNGEPVPVTSVAAASDQGVGISVVLTFDSSGSMAGAPIAAAKEAGKSLVTQLGDRDEVAIIAFSSDVRHLVPFTRDKRAAISAIDSLVAEGNTALYQAVAESGNTAGAAVVPRRAVVLLSDGVDFGGASGIDAPTSLNAAAASGAPYFVVGLGETIDQTYLQQLADVTRGQLLLAPTPDALSALYQNIASILRQQYLVTLDGSALEPGSAGALQITVSFGGQTASAETGLTVPGVLTVAPTVPPVTPEPTLVPAPTEATGGGSAVPLAVIAPAVGILAAAGVAGLFLWRRQRGRGLYQQPDLRRIEEQPTAVLFPQVAPAPQEEYYAFLELVTGAEPKTYPLGESPTTLGFTSDCTVMLPDGATTGWERVRIWRREGRFMLHNLSRMGAVQVAGKPATWAVLEDGDEVEIGSARLVFHDTTGTETPP
jgi:hypothetical protein